MPLRPLLSLSKIPFFVDSLKELVRLLVDEFTDGKLSTFPGFSPSWIHDYLIDDRQTSKSDWVVYSHAIPR
jgi:hypothetical protein